MIKVISISNVPSCQVDEVQHAPLGHLLAGAVLGLLHEVDADDGVGPGGGGVHVGACNCSVDCALFHFGLNFVVIAHHVLRKALSCKRSKSVVPTLKNLNLKCISSFTVKPLFGMLTNFQSITFLLIDISIE